MPTVSDLIHSSFRLIGAIAAGEILETNELNDALVSLNQMISSWNTEGVSLYGRSQMIVPIGPAANGYLLPLRPVRIDAASVEVNGIDCPLEIVDSVGWESIDEKYATAIRARKLFCTYNYPQSWVYIWPYPKASGVLELWVYALILPFANLTDTIDLPAGYEAAIRYNFAVNLLPEYPRSQVDASLIPQAQAFKASLAQLNASNHMKSQTGSASQSAGASLASTQGG